MRILHTSDWHVGRTIRGRSRADEHREVLAEIAAIADRERVDSVLVAGDVFDHAAPTPESEQIVYRGLLDLAQVAPVVVVSGNHDHPRRLTAVAPLLDLGRVTVVSSVVRPEDGGVVEVGGLRVAALPWTSRRSIVTADQLMEKDAFEHNLEFSARMGRVIKALCAPMSVETVNILVGHVMVHGAEMVGSERAVHTVFEYSVPTSALPGSLSYVALGHLHRQQRVPAPAPVWYSGSPLQLDFGETEDEKGVLVIEAEPGLPVTVNQVRLTAGRRLVRLQGTFEQVLEQAESVGDAHIRVELDEQPRSGLADEIRDRLPGVVDVALSRMTPVTTGVRAVRMGRPPVELFAEYLESVGKQDPAWVELFSELMDELYET